MPSCSGRVYVDGCNMFIIWKIVSGVFRDILDEKCLCNRL